MINKYIESIGFELEGGINFGPLEEIKKIKYNDDRFRVGGDGSVDVYGYDNPSVEIKFYSNKIKELFETSKLIWNSGGFGQNETCGNHLHIKIKEKYLNLIFWNDFVNYFIKEYINEYKHNDKYLSRLNNRYCKKNDNYYVLYFLNDYNLSRYRAINFLSLVHHSFKTIEIRVMPFAENFDEWKSQVEFVIKTITDYLKKGIYKKVNLKINIDKVDKKYVCNYSVSKW